MAYSEKIEALLRKAKAQPGDRLKVENPKGVFEGVLLPRPETGGSHDCIILKLDSGYNVGLSCAKAKLKKLEGSAALEQFASWVPHLAVNKKISLVATGGTISTRVDYKTGGVYMLLEPEQILAKVPELANVASISSIKSPFRKASEDMGFQDWQVLAKEVAKELNGDAEGVIVTHGTDTLHYTSAALSFMLKGLNKPVAVVGAQRSPDRGSFDGAQNLLCAAHYCLSDAAEVATVMHGTSNDDYCLANIGTKVRKMHTSIRDAFRPVNCQSLARIWPDGKKEFLWKDYNKRSDGKVVADVKFEQKTALVKPYPGASPEIIDFYVDKKYRGLIIEGTGLGHVPTCSEVSWIPSIARAIEKGVSVAVAPQCLYGKVHPHVYANLRALSSLGAIYCGDMLPETAYVKLGWALGHTNKPEKIRQMMLKNYAHEFNNRIQQEDFLV
ncbi:Glu-tRNA(Gln) amidotransferase subunit GatD [Candidatus Micrarchaeota archaeon]|nr:Glu-tRNA(Gln) amidotransferase subunit GatD [Candidatus Micrarchaeota archaeon]